VIEEIDRVRRTVAALERDDAAAVGQAFRASHASQRDLYETSVPGIDRLVHLAEAQPAVLGARLTGGGFGGSIVLVARAGAAAGAARNAAAAFNGETPGGAAQAI
jgi:galactokinase